VKFKSAGADIAEKLKELKVDAAKEEEKDSGKKK